MEVSGKLFETWRNLRGHSGMEQEVMRRVRGCRAQADKAGQHHCADGTDTHPEIGASRPVQCGAETGWVGCPGVTGHRAWDQG